MTLLRCVKGPSHDSSCHTGVLEVFPCQRGTLAQSRVQWLVQGVSGREP